VKNQTAKVSRFRKRESLTKSRFSRTNLFIFAVIFAVLGVYIIYSSFAAQPNIAPTGRYQVQGRHLYDPCGENVVIRGVEQVYAADGWLSPNGEFIPEIAKTGANTVRILMEYPPETDFAPMSVAQMENLIKVALANKMIPDVAIAGGKSVNVYLDPAIKTMLQKYQDKIILHAQGEGDYDDANLWVTNSKNTISQLRAAGYTMPLYILADYGGRQLKTVLNRGQEVFDSDPLHNIVFGWQAYWPTTDYQLAMRRAQEYSISWEWWDWRISQGSASLTVDPYTFGSWTQPFGADVAVNNTYSIKNTSVKTAYVSSGSTACAGPADSTPPTASVTAPTAGSTVSGTSVTLSANASDNVNVAGVQFKVDGNNVGSEDVTSPYSVAWNSTTVSNGTHAITAVARDAAGNSTTSSTVSVTVTNAPDTTAPTVSISAPASGSTISGDAVLSASASDNVGVTGVQFKVDGNNVSTEDTTSPYSISWDSTTASNGTHIITAAARDGAGNSTTSSNVSVTVNNLATNLNIGETNVLTLDDSGNGNTLLAQSASLSQTATLQSMSFYVATAAGKLRLGLYDSTGSGGGPGAKKAETGEITPVVGWNTANVITPVTLTSGTYWLAYLPSDNNLHFRLAGTGQERHYGFTYGSIPNTFSTSPLSGTAHWSLYASLVTGGTTPPPTPPPPPPSGPKTGDINGDNAVNITDLSLMLSSYGQSTTQCVTNNTYTCDLSSPGDGVVNIFDLSILLSKYGT
jgi:hypothetical protein